MGKKNYENGLREYSIAKEALSLVMILVLIVAGYELSQSLSYYHPEMNFVDFASYANSNMIGYCLVLILANLLILPMAILLYREQKISLKTEILEKDTLVGDILAGIFLLLIAVFIDCCFIPIYSMKSDLGYSDLDKMPLCLGIIGVISLVFVSGICKEIYFRGFAVNMCSAVFGEWSSLLLFNLLFAVLDWHNLGYSFLLGVLCSIGYKWRKHLIVPMIIHGGVNLVGIIYRMI